MKIQVHSGARLHEYGRPMLAWPVYSVEGNVQAVCIDCGDVRLLPGDAENVHTYVCATCEMRRLAEDRAARDAAGVRRCSCGKRLARLNMGPLCYACEDVEKTKPRPPEPPKKAPVPLDKRSKIVAAYIGGLAMAAVAAEFGVSESTVRDILKKAGVSARPCVADNGRRELAVKLGQMGHTTRGIAQAVGVSPHTVATYLREAGLGRKSRPGYNRSSPEVEARVIRLTAEGKSQSEIAREVHLSRSTVSVILGRARKEAK